MTKIYYMTIRCQGKLIDLTAPIVMGILNLTPDSFHDGGRYTDIDAILHQTEKMLHEGAGIIDIGGMSSKPGSTIIEAGEELTRVIEPIEAIKKRFPEAILSIDTIHATVAEQAVQAGCSIVNDISAGMLDAAMLPTVARLQVPYIIMHMRGTPATMQDNPIYTNVITEVMDFLAARVQACRAVGINDIVIDPGFGFGKTIEQNYQLLHLLSHFAMLGCPILAGLSRKSMITEVLNIKNTDALNGTTVLNTIALLQGANILRVHDVKEAIDAITIVQKLQVS